MCFRQNRDSLVPSQTETDSAMYEVYPFKAEQQDDEQGEKREETWNRRLRSLEECVCELLIKNQELRMSLLNDTANNNLRRLNSGDPSITTEGEVYDSPL
jgi:hypothetical protein